MTAGEPALDASSPFTLPGFFAALADGELLAATCRDCEQVLVPPRPACYGCGGRRLEIESQPKAGAVFSYTAVHAAPPELEADVPYVVAIVELDSGARLTGRLEAAYEEVAIGDRVRLRTRAPSPQEQQLALDHERDWPVHYFDPAA